ncbi:MAG: tetratricopeptide repeat protein [Fulvivirga sp.]|nr:tetratricopeptide repeat protein [Fulvivirga sp.]
MIIRITLYTFLVLLLGNAFAQSNIDSLHRILNQNPPESTRLKVSMNLMDMYFEQGYNEQAVSLGDSTLHLAQKMNRNKAIARVANRLGTIYTNMGGNENKALTYLHQALDLHLENGNLYGQGIVYNNLGNIYRDLAYDAKAMEFYVKSLAICQQIDDREGEAFALKNIGILYEYQDWYEKALEYHERALEIRKEHGTDYQIIASYLNVAIAYLGLDQYQKALDVLMQANEKSQVINSEMQDEILHELGNSHRYLNNYTTALSYYDHALIKAKEFKKYKVASSILSDIASLQIARSDFLGAKYTLQQFDSLLDSISYVRGLISYHELNYKLDSSTNNELDALKHFKKMSELRDSIYQIANSEELIQQRTALELVQHENQLELEKAKQRYQQRVYTYVVVFLLISVAALSFAIYMKLRSNRKLNAQKNEISKKNETLNNLNRKLNDAIEKLQDANATIAEQNTQISAYNETLEKKVEKRTKELMNYSKQLEKYAFITAHNLRAPVARMLGLGHLLSMTKDEKEKPYIISKLIDATKDIDKVIQEINVMLEEKPYFKKINPFKAEDQLPNR